jgi:hypothetical protein
MALFDTTWYCNAGDQSTTGYYAVTKRPQNTAVAAGVIRRQFTAPAVGSERCFVCIVAGTTANTTDATWVLTRGALTTDGTATWQECTGASAVNGDATNTPTWAAAKAISSAVTLGAIIKRANGASYWICSTAGSTGASEPAWSNDTAGTTQADGTVTWTCLGVVGNFSGGGAPHARLVNACVSTWFVAGNTVYVGDNHAETQSAPNMVINASGSFTILSKILCHNHSGSYPPAAGDLTTGATVSATAFATIALTFGAGGGFYIYGLVFKAGSGSTGSSVYFLINNSGGWAYFDACSVQIIATGASNIMQVGSNSSNNTYSLTIFNNTTVYFGNTTDTISVLFSQFIWQNTGQVLVSGSSVPANLLAATASGGLQNNITLEALDLSQLTGNLFSASQTNYTNLMIKDCKTNAAATIQTPAQNSGTTVQLVRSDSGATGYKSARYQYEGVETTETSITRVGGASDPAGQSQSRKIVTTANINWLRPFKAEPYAIWNPTTAANVTITILGTINAGALPNNDDIWIEVEYLGSASFPIGTIKTTTKASVLAANAAVASDGSTWNGGGSGAGWTPFKLSAVLSSPQPGFAAFIEVRVRAAKASTTYYIDPLVVLS